MPGFEIPFDRTGFEEVDRTGEICGLEVVEEGEEEGGQTVFGEARGSEVPNGGSEFVVAPVLKNPVVEDEDDREAVFLDTAVARLARWTNARAFRQPPRLQRARRERRLGHDGHQPASCELAEEVDVVPVDRGAEDDDGAVVEPGEGVSREDGCDEGRGGAALGVGMPAVLGEGRVGGGEVAGGAEGVAAAAR